VFVLRRRGTVEVGWEAFSRQFDALKFWAGFEFGVTVDLNMLKIFWQVLTNFGKYF
jgi:hypothetical protein